MRRPTFAVALTLAVAGCGTAQPFFREGDANMVEIGYAEGGAELAQLAAEGKLRMPIEAEFPLERAGEAMEHVATGHTVGRVVLRMT